MFVNIEDILFWMDAIRNSDDRYRTLESFWKGQIYSKIWLIDNLKPFIVNDKNTIIIHAGWNGVLSSLLFNSNISIRKIISVDKDQNCKNIALTVNKRQEMEGKFFAVTEDMTKFNYDESPDIVINTSCEHITDKELQKWYSQIPQNTLVVLQSNNYFNLDEHINCVTSATDLANKIDIDSIMEGSYSTPLYDRFMAIGYKK
jgi:hypothetical protein